MAYTAWFSVSVGDPTKASDVSVLAANDDYLKAAVDAAAAAASSSRVSELVVDAMREVRVHATTTDRGVPVSGLLGTRAQSKVPSSSFVPSKDGASSVILISRCVSSPCKSGLAFKKLTPPIWYLSCLVMSLLSNLFIVLGLYRPYVRLQRAKKEVWDLFFD